MDVMTLKIRGDDAIRLLNEHRSRYRSTGLYPFLIGDAEDLERVEEAVDFHEQDAAAIITASLEIEPAQWFADRQREAEKYEFSADETLGEWPGEALDKGSIMLHKHLTSGKVKREVFIGLARIEEPWHLPAVVKFGSWNACPAPEEHFALHREWQETYGAEITGMSGDVVECVVRKPPVDRDAATLLAWQQYWYCEDNPGGRFRLRACRHSDERALLVFLVGLTPMANEQIWNDESRDELRQTLQSVILGKLRLANETNDEILEACRETYIQEEAPEGEWATFLQLAEDELNRAAARLAAEKATWPAETDCDRLDRVEAALRDRGIVLWQVSPCCDTCALGELAERVEVINGRFPGFRERLRGYAFFIDQNMPAMLADSTDLSVYLGYGWFSPDGSEVAREIYEKQALTVGREVCQCLRDEGFEPDWNGTLDRKIGLSLNWQRRTMLE